MFLAQPRLTRYLVPSFIGMVALIAGGCSGNGELLTAPAAAGSEQPPSSVEKIGGPSSYKALTTKLNNYRSQTYGVGQPYTATFNDTLYTAAYRHSKNVESTNSADASRRVGVVSGVEVLTITSASTLTTLSSEIGAVNTLATQAEYPLLFTSVDKYNRVRAVQGGDNLLFNQSANGSVLFENFVFNGNTTTLAGKNSEFRGFNLDLFYNASAIVGDNDFAFDIVDNLWYTRRGRHALIQPTMRQWAYGSHADTGLGMPYPYPILNGRFLGTALSIADRPLTQMQGVWPNDGNIDVTPYGLDTDLQNVLPAVAQDSAYAGPPIHFTLPVAEPFVSITLNFALDTSTASFPAGWPNRWKKVAIFTNQDPTIMKASVLQITLPDVVVLPGEFIGEVKLNSQSDPAIGLRDGELYFQTLGPLVPNAKYLLSFTAKTNGQSTYTYNGSFTTNKNSSF